MRIRSAVGSTRGLWCIALAFLAGCSPAPVPIDSDAASTDASDSFVMDAPVDAPQCTRNADCDDGRFCNGVERCLPDDPAADSRGCTVPAQPACSAGMRCDEAAGLCRPTDDAGDDAGDSGSCDEDHDGVRSVACGGADCDDHDAQRYPGNPERCGATLPDGRAAADHDEDCNPCTVFSPSVDGDGDSDHDGFPAATCINPWLGTTSPLGCDLFSVRIEDETAMAHPRTVVGADCSDAERTVNPNTTEVCGNAIDDNCNGAIDEDVTGTLYRDTDNDGRGDNSGGPDTTMSASLCRSIPGWVDNHDDCDDTRSETYSGARELCDGRDNDCSSPGAMAGGPDDSEDRDHDRHASLSAMCLGYREPGAPGFAMPKDDCDDDAATVYTGAPEICANGIDEDCDRIVDNSTQRVCNDEDGDGHGDAATMRTVMSCTLPVGTVTVCDDCDDAATTGAQRFPGNREVCDRVDNDCSTPATRVVIDEDVDDDGFASAGASCAGRGEAGVPASAFPRTDCNDSDNAVHPGTTEVCNGVDDNCDGMIDTDASGTLYRDADNDGRGDNSGAPGTTMLGTLCVPPTGWVSNRDDCDDTRSETFLGAREQCDRRDNDCSLPGAMAGGIDATEDVDGDAHSSPSAMCVGRGEPGALGFAQPKDDCNDTVATIYTGATELCGNGVDEDCDLVPDNPSQRVCDDRDGDGHGDATTSRTVMTCTLPMGTVTSCDDCDDSLTTGSRRFPGNREVCDRIDNDCTTPMTIVAVEEDVDDDGYSPMTATCAARGEAGAPASAFPRSDCVDSVASIHPGAVESCDRVDSDCSSGGGVAPEEDADSDGYAARLATCVARGEPQASSMALPRGDCDDTRGLVNPGRTEDLAVCDGLDNDCNDLTTEVTVPCATGGTCGVGGVCTRALQTQQISASNHTCVRLVDGTVRCWGNNQDGQLGDGTLVNRSVPTPVIGLSNAVDVQAGYQHTCARLYNGTVACWGLNTSGQLGDGTTMMRRSTPTPVPGLTGVAQIVVGGMHTCARLGDGTVQCWGNNGDGELGDGTTTRRISPTPVPGLANVIALASESGHTCALSSIGTVRCWGSNLSGQIGDGSSTSRTSPTLVTGVSGVVGITTGTNHSCARLANGTVRCWGRNASGQIGDGTTFSRYISVAVTGIVGAAEIAAGGNETCARLGDGSVRCWGENLSGQIGDGTTVNRVIPTLVPGLAGIAEVAVGYTHVCTRSTLGTMRCWGDNTRGQLGDGTTTSRVSPTPVPGFSGTVELTAGQNHTCARLDDSTVRCWGRNNNGQLGDGTMTNQSLPIVVPGLSNVTQLASKGSHTCARMNDATLRCWGYNNGGQIGDGSTTTRLVPTAVPGLAGVAQVAAGQFHTCARLNDGTVTCWGVNASGQLGDGTTTNRSTPTPVPGLAGVVDLAAGAAHTCARLNNDTVQCWGSNAFGQIGDGTTTQRNSPTAVPMLTTVRDVSLGANHTCVASSDGTARCWGRNVEGEIGDGTTIDRWSPTVVSGLAGVVELGVGGVHSCARLNDGTVRCWGTNSEGQLGDGTRTRSLLPVTVSMLSNAAELVTGMYHSCARSTDGTVRCWGWNPYGEVGDGTTIMRIAPVTVWPL